MLDISNNKLVRVIYLTREYGPDSRQVADYVSGLNEDEQISLVTVVWIGRGTFEPDDLEEAMSIARHEATAPTQDYLAAMPDLAEHLEAGMEALGADVMDAEDHFRD